MRQAVKDRFHAFSTPFEGRRYHMYLDVKGFVTTGVGNLLASPQAASALPFKPDGVGGKAAEGDIEAAWQTVKDAKPGLPTSVSAKDQYGKLTNLRLTDQDVDNLVDSMLGKFDLDLVNKFKTAGNPPSYQNYANFCADAQLGLLSMQWPGSLNTFLNFLSAVRDGDWFAAAKQCYFDTKNNAGILARNRANRWLFSVAGRMERFQADPDLLHYGPQDPQGLNKVFLLKGAQCIRYDWDSDLVDSGLLGNYFKLPAPFDTGVRAAFNGYGNEKVPHYFGKTYFVKGAEYVRYDWDTDTVDVLALPLSKWGLTGDFAQGIDAAFNGYGTYEGKLYFFKGDKYVRYDWAREKIDVTPTSIGDAWSLPPEFQNGVDAIVNGEGKFFGKLYFLKDDKYVRFRWKPTYAQEGPVKWIKDGWDGTHPIGFSSGLNALVNPPGRT